jgi:hypothetical protein
VSFPHRLPASSFRENVLEVRIEHRKRHLGHPEPLEFGHPERMCRKYESSIPSPIGISLWSHSVVILSLRRIYSCNSSPTSSLTCGFYSPMPLSTHPLSLRRTFPATPHQVAQPMLHLTLMRNFLHIPIRMTTLNFRRMAGDSAGYRCSGMGLVWKGMSMWCPPRSAFLPEIR